jgi:hypothetical protein
LYLRSEELALNVQCPAGSARVQITDSAGRPIPGYEFDNSVRFVGDQTDWRPSWRGGTTLRDQVGRAVRVEIELTNGRLYAIRGDFRALTGGECRRFEELGEVPRDTAGY